MSSSTGSGEESPLMTRDSPVGYQLQPIKKKAAIQLMGSRLWGRFNPNHWDPVYASATGLKAPIQTGEMSSAYLAEMCVNHFGAAMFRNARVVCKYVASTLANEVITDPMASSARRCRRATATASSSTSGATTRRAKRRLSAGSRSTSASEPPPLPPSRSADTGKTLMTTEALRTDELRPMSEIQIAQTRAFIEGLEQGSQSYWDMVQVGDELSRDLHITPELVILYADAVEDFNPWYEAWKMNTWHIAGESPFGRAIVPPLLVSHFVLSVQFDQSKPFAIGSIHTYHDSEIVEPIPVGATVRITTRAIDKYEKRGRRYVRHQVTVTDSRDGTLYFRETRDILSL